MASQKIKSRKAYRGARRRPGILPMSLILCAVLAFGGACSAIGPGAIAAAQSPGIDDGRPANTDVRGGAPTADAGQADTVQADAEQADTGQADVGQADEIVADGGMNVFIQAAKAAQEKGAAAQSSRAAVVSNAGAVAGAAGGANAVTASGSAAGAGAEAAAEAAVEPVDLSGLSILAINSSRAVVNGQLTDLVSDLPGLASYLRQDRTYAPAEYVEKSFGLTSTHNESRGNYRLKKGDDIILSLAAEDYDYSLGNDGKVIVYLPLRKVIEALGKHIAYYDGLLVISDGPSPFSPARDAAQLSDIRASLTGAISVESAEKYEKLMQSADLAYYGPFSNYLAYMSGRQGRGSVFDLPFFIGGGAGMDTGGFGVMPTEGFMDDVAQAAPEPAPTRAPRSEAEADISAAPAAALQREERDEEALSGYEAGGSDKSYGAGGDEFSTTNVQVEGVDESDVVKTDGRYIYQVNGQRILIIDAYPPSGMKMAGELDFGKERGAAFTPYEMYVDGDTLVVVGASWRDTAPPQPVPRATSAPVRGGAARDIVSVDMAMAYPYYRAGEQTTLSLVFDIKDRSAPKLVRESEIEGSYKTSRKIGGALYIVTNKSYNYYYPYSYGVNDIGGIVEDWEDASEVRSSDVAGEGASAGAGANAGSDASKTAEAEAASLTVAYSDSATTGGRFVDIGFPAIYYFPGCVSRNYLIVAGIDTRDVDKPISVESILDYGNNVYVSNGSLYIATQYSRYFYYDYSGNDSSTATTSIHRFGLDNGQVKYEGKGEVPGNILNQFSMDEFDGYFRVATTSETYSHERGYRSQNNLYVLDGDLKLVGRLEGLAPGEIIYSVRFMGKKAYIVTFRTIDPLFVIDLSDPAAPKVLGALKIPGYSDYLHPYDENHIIGFGKDTVEYSYGYGDPVAYYQGMKIALFDVSDVENPIELFKTEIGDRGTDSELLRNHRALLFSRERELLAFPVTVMTVPASQRTGNLERDATAYGQFEFQGAYVYSLNLKDGFTLRGKITHISRDEYLRAGSYYWGGEDNAIDRLLYIRDSLYALSKAFITSSDIANPERETGRLALK